MAGRAGEIKDKNVGEVITMFLGPITGRNYNVAGLATPPNPAIRIKVIGTGSVQVQQTQTAIFKGNSGHNAFTYDREPNPATWANLGTAIDSGDGVVTVNPTADGTFCAVQVVVSATGTGKVIIQSDWR